MTATNAIHLPALNHIYPFWLRCRWGILAGAIYILILHALIRSVPWIVPQATICLSVPLAIGLANFLAAFAYGSSDLIATRSGFPSYLLILPLRTRTLVAWPMFCGALTLAISWLLIASLVLIPGHILVPLFWPAALLAAFVGWVQAISWSPVPLGEIRPLVAMLMLGLLSVTTGLCAVVHLPPFLRFFIFLGFFVAAYATAVVRLSIARRGDGQTFPQVFGKSVAKPTIPRNSPFGSPRAAHLWLEWRSIAIGLPAVTFLICLLFASLAVWTGVQSRSASAFIGRHASISLTLLGACLGTPLLMCTFAGASFGRFDPWAKQMELPAFFAVRPLGCGDFVFVKLLVAALSVVVCWAIALTIAAISALIIPTGTHWHPSLGWRLFSAASPGQITTALVTLLLAIFASWRSIAVGLFTALTGRKWVITTSVLTGLFPIVVIGIALVFFQVNPPVFHRFQQTLVPLLTKIIVILALLKISLAMPALIALTRLRLISEQFAWLGVFVWITLASCLITLAQWRLHNIPNFRLEVLAAVIVLFLPLTRIALAPLALHWNRHR